MVPQYLAVNAAEAVLLSQRLVLRGDGVGEESLDMLQVLLPKLDGGGDVLLRCENGGKVVVLAEGVFKDGLPQL